MSPLRKLGLGALIAAVAVAGAACSSDDSSGTKSDRGTVSFADPPPGSTDLGLCSAYDIDDMKDLIGGDETFKRLPPTAIGAKGDPVTGEACAWERTETNGDALSVRIEARDYGEDVALLDEQFGALKDGTISAETVDGLGDEAFSSESDETSLLQIRTGQYLLTLSSRAAGDLSPVDVKTLQFLANGGLEQLS